MVGPRPTVSTGWPSREDAPTGAGSSNLVDVLVFVSEALRCGLPVASLGAREALVAYHHDGVGGTWHFDMPAALPDGVLYEAIQAHASDVIGTPIGYYDGHPYFFIDVDGDGEISPEEAVRANAYDAFTPRLLRAAHNYQYATKDTGSYAHNGQYIIELLHDSLASTCWTSGPVSVGVAPVDAPSHTTTATPKGGC